jgi:hypothetical protein
VGAPHLIAWLESQRSTRRPSIGCLAWSATILIGASESTAKAAW